MICDITNTQEAEPGLIYTGGDEDPYKRSDNKNGLKGGGASVV